MKYQNIAGSSTCVSSLSVGGNIFGYACDAIETQRILAAAEELGVNMVDTADVYSEGRSEEFIGQALLARRNRWILATKVGVKSGDTGSGAATRQNIQGRVEHSLRRLRTDHIDIYQLHHFDPETPIEETLQTAAQLRAQGKIIHFSVSNCSVGQICMFEEASLRTGLPRIATNQVHYNLLKRNIEHEMMPLFQSRGLGLLVYGVLGRGVLSGKYREGQPVPDNTRATMSSRVRLDLQPHILRVVARLETFCLEAGISLPELAVAYVLRFNVVLSAVVGMRSVEQLQTVARATDLDLGASFWEKIDEFLCDLGELEGASLGHS